MAYNRYQYETSPRKLKPEYETIKKTYPKKSTARKKNNKTSRSNKKKESLKTEKSKREKIVLYVAIGFIALFAISYRYSVIDKTYANLKGLRADLGTIEKETAQLEANIESSLNLTKIEQDAKNLLGMQKLSSGQIVYVTLPKIDYVETSSEEIMEEDTNSNWLIRIFNKIIDTLK